MKITKNNQKGRLLLTNSFFIKMVQMRRCFLTTCTKPVHEEKNIKKMYRFKQESGRSMVEMLGVLAIIGVLSIGAIAGYSKAMQKHNINKMINEMTNTTAIARTVFANDNPSDITCKKDLNSDGCKTLQKLNILPQLKQGDNRLVSSNGLESVQIQTVQSHTQLRFTYKQLTPEVCVALLSADWSNTGLLTVNKNLIFHAFFTPEGQKLLNYDPSNNLMSTLPASLETLHNQCKDIISLMFSFKLTY